MNTKKARNRKILIYAGLAGAGLLLLLLMRKKGAAGPANTTTGEGVLQAPGNLGETGAGAGIESNLAQFQGNLEAALPGLIAGGVQTGLDSGLGPLEQDVARIEANQEKLAQAVEDRSTANPSAAAPTSKSTHGAKPKPVHKKHVASHHAHAPKPAAHHHGSRHHKPAAAHHAAHAKPRPHVATGKAAPRPHRGHPHHRHK
jgi:hypothetical protein